LQRANSPQWDIEEDGRPLPSESSRSGTPDPASDDLDVDVTFIPNASASPRTPDMKSDSKSELTPPSTMRGQKRKSMADQIAEVSAFERRNRIKIADIQSKAKTDRSNERERIKCRAHLEMEVNCLQHATQEAAAQRAHEVMMFDRQAALELARAGNVGAFAAHIGHDLHLDNIHPELR